MTSRYSSLTEERCRRAMENLLGAEFPSCRPDFLINPETGGRLQLDGYNAQLGIAFEYNGQQHYEWPNIFHHQLHDFVQQVRRDNYKYLRCGEEGIYLLIIPYTEAEVETYIEKRLVADGRLPA